MHRAIKISPLFVMKVGLGNTEHIKRSMISQNKTKMSVLRILRTMY